MKKTPLEYSLYLLSMRDRSEHEIRKKMAEKEISAEEIDKTVAWLFDKKFLDDTRLAENYTKSGQLNERNGKRKILLKLQQLGIDQDVISENIEKIDGDSEHEKALNLAKQWLAKKNDVMKKYDKLGRFLVGRGFDYEIVKKVLGEVLK